MPLQTGLGCAREVPFLSRSQRMKAYLVTTGVLFGLLAGAHLARTFLEARRLVEDPWFILEGPGIGVIGGTLAVWAWRLARSTRPAR
jgi:hypothetical protein